MTVNARHHYHFFDDHLSRGICLCAFNGFVNSLKIENHEKYWKTKDEEESEKDNPKNVHIFTSSCPLFNSNFDSEVIDFMKYCYLSGRKNFRLYLKKDKNKGDHFWLYLNARLFAGTHMGKNNGKHKNEKRK